MPIYEFECPRCGRGIERFYRSIREYEKKGKPDCRACGAEMVERPSLVAEIRKAPTDPADEGGWKRVHSRELEAKKLREKGRGEAASRAYEEAAKATEEIDSKFAGLAKGKFLEKARQRF